MYRLMGQYYFSSISVRIKDGVSSSIAEQQIIKLLTRVHGRKDFYTRNSDSIYKPSKNHRHFNTVNFLALR